MLQSVPDTLQSMGRQEVLSQPRVMQHDFYCVVPWIEGGMQRWNQKEQGWNLMMKQWIAVAHTEYNLIIRSEMMVEGQQVYMLTESCPMAFGHAIQGVEHMERLRPQKCFLHRNHDEMPPTF